MNGDLIKIGGISLIALLVGLLGGYMIRGKGTADTAMNKHMSAAATEATQKEETAPVDHASAEWKIQNAMSAAPENVSAQATVIDWPLKEGEDFSSLKKGTNEWTCLPDDPGTPGNDPVCVDAMAMQWFGAYMSKKTPKVAQAGLAYMLQGGSDASNVDPYAKTPKEGEAWMDAPPHLMVFPTTPPDPKVYGTDMHSGGPWVMWANTPYAHLMIPVE